jgi:hypothetical protein
MSSTEDIKIFDVDEVFALNPDMKISMSYIGEYQLPLIIIDDFYKNPQSVRDVLISTPVPRATSQAHGGYPGLRVAINGFINSPSFQKGYSDILKREFKVGIDMENRNNEFLGNVFDGSGPAKKFNSSVPHYDPPIIASIIYLNLDSEEVGGTSVYRHRASNLPFYPANKFHFEWWIRQVAKVEKKPLDVVAKEQDAKIKRFGPTMFATPGDLVKQNCHILESNDEWEILATVDSKFNRLAGYIGGTLHSAMIDFDELALKPYKRINQVLFMDPAQPR